MEHVVKVLASAARRDDERGGMHIGREASVTRQEKEIRGIWTRKKEVKKKKILFTDNVRYNKTTRTNK